MSKRNMLVAVSAVAVIALFLTFQYAAGAQASVVAPLTPEEMSNVIGFSCVNDLCKDIGDCHDLDCTSLLKEYCWRCQYTGNKGDCVFNWWIGNCLVDRTVICGSRELGRCSGNPRVCSGFVPYGNCSNISDCTQY